MKGQDRQEQTSDNMDEQMNNRMQEEQTVKSDRETALEAELADKEIEITALSDKYLRLMAEYDNYRKRSQKEKEAIYNDSVVQVVREWLPVIDNLDRAEFAADQYKSEDARQIADGISMIRKQVTDVLDKLGVAAIDCCGQPFDPNLHDAVMHVEDESAAASTVVEELRKGYVMGDRVIRHSVVKVAN
ncbi:MAG: nucleotide exchange factor GrpE [Ruminococcaceae bacterium]|jgi:molecular chaperone GrpE|nr:nucleotide exchange factor GrpE [Oscillospiraceae bacterium]